MNMKSEPLIITEFVLKTSENAQVCLEIRICVLTSFFFIEPTLLWPFSVVCVVYVCAGPSVVR